jgi:Cu(I)/Ag(I) efflux system membrane protein CusA/SilA
VIDRIIDYSVRHKWAVIAIVSLASLAGAWSLRHAQLDALPELGDTQVIIYSRWDRSPELIEAQVTYPIVTSMMGAPHVKSVRGVSDFGYSYVYVIFDENTDQYWARSRTLEYLAGIAERLPEGVKTELGPDAASLGWVYQYVLIDKSRHMSLAELRSYQDWYLRYWLRSVPGVADVAPIGGYTRQFQVNVDPNKLRAHGIALSEVVDAVRDTNGESSARVLDFGGTEYMIRGRGYANTVNDFAETAIRSSSDGTPIRIKDIGQVVEGPQLRRGIADWEGSGEAVSGIVIMRSGENALDVISRVKARIREIQPSLPSGIEIVPVYDRSQLIEQTIHSTRETIIEVLATIVIIVLVFLWHFPSAAIPLVTMPAAVLVSLIPIRMLGISVNVMSLAGIAIAFGELIDASIVVVEQTHKKLEQWEKTGRPGRHRDVILGAVKQVAAPSFFSLLVIALSFLPLLTLEGQEGRLFRPLVYTKTLAMISAALMAITLDPALRLLLARTRKLEFRPAWLCAVANRLFVGRITPEEANPVSRFLMRTYEPVLAWALRRKSIVFIAAAALLLATLPVAYSLGSEFLPPMDEGAILYMPTSMPGMSVAQAQRVLQAADLMLTQFPEVDHVLGKSGRAETATDPAPISMLESLITLKPHSQWPRQNTWYSSWAPEWLKGVLRHITPDTVSTSELVDEMNSALRVPGLSNAWTMPIRGRVEMLNSGIRTPLGIKIFGDDPKRIDQIGQQISSILSSLRGTRGVFAEATNQGYFLDVRWRRDELARFGISVRKAEETLSSAVGGEDIGTVYDGRARYTVNVRYLRDYRSDADAIAHILVTGGGGQSATLAQLADIKAVSGPAMIRDENAMLTGYVYIDIAGISAGTYLSQAQKLLQQQLVLPPGYSLAWGGQSEAMERARQRLFYIVPITIAIVLLLLFINTRSLTKTLIVLLAVPFSAIGAIWSIYLLHYNMSVAVWVGIIALLSIDAETGVFMLLYLDIAFDDARKSGRMRNWDDLRQAVMFGAAKRLRPKFMTFATACIGLFPVMWSIGTGSEVMKRIVAPMIGGIFTSFALELIVYPAIYEIWKRREFQKAAGSTRISEHERECEELTPAAP